MRTRTHAKIRAVIVVAGEALIDLVLAAGGDISRHPGGGPFNTARGLARLGQPAAFLGRISTDRLGQQLRAALEADGVDVAGVVATDDPTTLAVAEIDADGSARYRFYVDGTSVPGLLAATLPAGADTLHVGSLGLALEPIATTLAALVDAAPAETLVMLDPNVRPALIADPAAYRARLARIAARSDVVKVSEEDLAWLAPASGPVAAARELLGPDPAVALVTRGAAGAIVVTAAEAVEVPPVPAAVVSTIGAGDAFGAGFLAWWRRRGLGRNDLGRLDAAVAATGFACLVAARTCERAGAEPPRLDRLTERGG